jgi:hypothetical protein
MHEDVKREHLRILDLEEVLTEDEMAGAADRKELCKPLKQTKDESLKDRHRIRSLKLTVFGLGLEPP